MDNYNKILTDTLSDVSKTSAEKDGAKKVLMGLKTAANVLAVVNPAIGGPARMLLGIADAAMKGLDGDMSDVDLDKLFVQSATDQLAKQGIKPEDIDRIMQGK